MAKLVRHPSAIKLLKLRIIVDVDPKNTAEIIAAHDEIRLF
ncbi:hypothetical protein [Mesorhizobium sp. 1B3]